MQAIEIVFWTVLFLIVGTTVLYKVMQWLFNRDIDLDLQESDIYDDTQ